MPSSYAGFYLSFQNFKANKYCLKCMPDGRVHESLSLPRERSARRGDCWGPFPAGWWGWCSLLELPCWPWGGRQEKLGEPLFCFPSPLDFKLDLRRKILTVPAASQSNWLTYEVVSLKVFQLAGWSAVIDILVDLLLSWNVGLNNFWGPSLPILGFCKPLLWSA